MPLIVSIYWLRQEGGEHYGRVLIMYSYCPPCIATQLTAYQSPHSPQPFSWREQIALDTIRGSRSAVESAQDMPVIELPWPAKDKSPAEQLLGGLRDIQVPEPEDACARSGLALAMR